MPGPGLGVTSEESAELRKLRAEVRELRRANEILLHLQPPWLPTGSGWSDSVHFLPGMKLAKSARELRNAATATSIHETWPSAGCLFLRLSAGTRRAGKRLRRCAEGSGQLVHRMAAR
jgi:hypothetical protein